MAISTTCPGCKALFRLADNLSGKKVQCQKCHKLFVVPAADGSMTVAGTSVPDEKQSTDSMFGEAPSPAGSNSTAANPAMSLPAFPTEPTDAEAKPADEGPLQEDVEDPSSISVSQHKEDSNDLPRRERKNSVAKSNVPTFAIVSILIGGGLLSCCVCVGGGLGFWIYQSNETKKVEAIAKEEAKKQEEAKKIEDAKKKAGLPPGWEGTLVAFGPDNVYRSDNILNFNDPVNPIDPQRGGHYKLYVVQLEAGKSYQIDLMSQQFDAFLYLEDDRKKIVAFDDDGGGNLNSLIVHRPERTGFFRIYATTFAPQQTGNFTLMVRRF